MEILYFTPHAALWPHTAPEAFLARALGELGHSIRYLTCGKALSYCAPMTARHLAPAAAHSPAAIRVCQTCKTASNAISRMYGFPVDALADHVSDEDIVRLDAVAARAVAAKSLDTEYLGVKVGRVALYEFTLAHKKMSTDLTDAQWEEYEIYLANALRAMFSFSNYIERYCPDVIMTFSPQYSNINACMQYALNRGIRVMFNESGTNIAHRLGTMRVWDWKKHGLVNPALTYWGKSDDNIVTKASAHAVSDHFEQLLAGYHFAVFSSPSGDKVDVRSLWNIHPKQKILLMTLSSYDEAYAALLVGGFPEAKVFSDVFYTQAEWVKATLDWVSARPDLFLIIRVHPRDFPNKRDSIRSEQSFILQELLDAPPENVHVNWPSENISFYDLLDDANVLLTGWSVTAMEALVLGIPVVTYDSNLPSYPADIHYTGRNVETYFYNIDRALADGWRLENAINGFRWLAYNFVSCTVEVSSDFGNFELGKQNLFKKYIARIKGRLPAIGFSLDLLHWKGARAHAPIISSMLLQDDDALPPVQKRLLAEDGPTQAEEKQIILQALARIAQKLYGNGNIPPKNSGTFHELNRLLESEKVQ